MPAKTRRKYEGNAVSTTITSNLGNGVGDTSISVTAATGWPSSGPFYVVIDPGTASEEKMLVGTISGTALSSITRGVDGTSRVSHSSGAIIYPVFTAVDADEANELTSKYTTRGDMVYQGASTFETLAKGTTAHVLKQGANDPAWGFIVDANVDNSAAIALSKLATGALPSGITVASANLVDGTIASGDLASATLQLLAPAGSITQYIGASAPTGWLLCDGSTVTNGQTLHPDLWAVLPAAFKSGANIVLPNMKGRVVVGLDSADTAFDALGETGGSKTSVAAHTHGVGTYATASSGSHSHNLKQSTQVVYQDAGNNRTLADAFGTGSASFIESAGAHTHTLSGSSASTGDTNGNLPPYIVMNYIIKT